MCILCVLMQAQVAAAKTLPPAHTTFQLPRVHLDKSIDHDAWSNLPAALTRVCPDRIVPVITSGDGNCLLHAVSRYIFGVELYHELLRKKMHEELVANKEWYRAAAKEFEDKDWDRIVTNASRSGHYLEFMHSLALANVLKRPMILYGSDADMERYGLGESGVAATFVPARFKPSECVNSGPIILAWQSGHKNHYVAVVDVEGAERFTEWPVLPPAFPDGLPAETTAQMYIKPDGPIVLPQLNQRLSEEKSSDDQSELEQVQQLMVEYKKRIDLQRRQQEQEREMLLKLLLQGGDGSSDPIMFGGGTQPMRIVEVGEDEEEEMDDDEEMMYRGQPSINSMAQYAKYMDKLREDMARAEEIKRQQLAEQARIKLEAEELEKKRKREQFLAQRQVLPNGRELLKGVQWDFVQEVNGTNGPAWLPFDRDESPETAADRFFQLEGMTNDPGMKEKIVGYISGKQEQARIEKQRRAELRATYQASAPKGKRIPLREDAPVIYATAQFDGIMKKLTEFNSIVAADPKYAGLSLGIQDNVILNNMVEILKGVAAYNTTRFDNSHFEVVSKLFRWPVDRLFPILDILRVLALHPHGAECIVNSHRLGQKFLPVIFSHAQPTVPPSPNSGIVLKFIANMFSHQLLRIQAGEDYETILKTVAPHVTHEAKVTRQIVANILLNYAVHYPHELGPSPLKSLLFVMLEQMLSPLRVTASSPTSSNSNITNTTEAPEILFSVLSAIGQLCYADPELCLDLREKRPTLLRLIEQHASSTSEAKVREVAADILALLAWSEQQQPQQQQPQQQQN
eukprot:TRINITY_DN4219_c0_g1_i1.p1 TRINITY_DN4219_c0_g1~~TRINITY_DN4219_c0_g1_i1.p1  ORF type:complete len:798 (-),score=152.19 TRINITY_DN4219_c0_g1_i1:24-2417(-)